jgi:RNA polymerase sigma factor (sigma-70 family)
MGLGTDDRVIAVITENAASLLRIARAHSLCADDAHDAYQRTLEIYLERLDHVEDATAGQYLRTVCKHEAMRIRDQRMRILPAEEVSWDRHESVDARDPEERASALDRVARAAEALQALTPDQVTAVLLRADGSSYAEIGALTGWSYTKVNRSLTEGRARFLARFAAIDSGSACDAWAPVLSAIVDGEAKPADLTRVRPHLRHCSSCRATLRALYESEPALGALVPAGAVAVSGGAGSRMWEAVVTGLGDRLARLHAAFELVTSTKAAAVVVSTAAVAAGGAAVAHHPDRPRRPPALADAAAPVPAPVRERPVRRNVAPAARASAAAARMRGKMVSVHAPAPVVSVEARRVSRPEFGFERVPRASSPAATMHRKSVAAIGGRRDALEAEVGREFGFEG